MRTPIRVADERALDVNPENPGLAGDRRVAQVRQGGRIDIWRRRHDRRHEGGHAEPRQTPADRGDVCRRIGEVVPEGAVQLDVDQARQDARSGSAE